MFPLTDERLDEILSRIPDLRIAVIGDFFLDKYMVTDPALAEMSVETGLEARQVVEVRCSPGAAGTVTNNLAALGVGTIHAVGAIGDDGEGYELLRGLRERGVTTDRLLRARDRFTPTYTKPMVRTPDGETELNRLDIKNRAPLSAEWSGRILSALEELLTPGPDRIHAVAIMDQVQERDCGSITDAVREGLESLAAQHDDVLFFADSRVRIGEYRNVTIKPNAAEAARAIGRSQEPANLNEAIGIGSQLAIRNQQTVFLTLGEDGILVCRPGSVDHVPALSVNGPIDIVGAGDSTTAGIVCALCSNASPQEAAALGNLCAPVTIRKLGTTGTASPSELRERPKATP
jgi:rfaE bifunctional protein kinase chain/domain